MCSYIKNNLFLFWILANHKVVFLVETICREIWFASSSSIFHICAFISVWIENRACVCVIVCAAHIIFTIFTHNKSNAIEIELSFRVKRTGKIIRLSLQFFRVVVYKLREGKKGARAYIHALSLLLALSMWFAIVIVIVVVVQIIWNVIRSKSNVINTANELNYTYC